MLNESTSFNNKLILEAYEHTGLKAEVKSGWATLSQRNSLKGLKLLVRASITNGSTLMVIDAGSIAYIKEETLNTQAWAKNKQKCDTISGEFIIATINDVEYIAPPKEDDAA